MLLSLTHLMHFSSTSLTNLGLGLSRASETESDLHIKKDGIQKREDSMATRYFHVHKINFLHFYRITISRILRICRTGVLLIIHSYYLRKTIFNYLKGQKMYQLCNETIL